MAVSLDALRKALVSLETAVVLPKNDIVRDAVIQRFEFSVELAWKVSKKVLGTSSTAPRVVIREMAAQGLITEPELWFEFLDRRNDSSHTYNEDIAERVYSAAQQFAPVCRQLLFKLEQM